MTSEHKVFECPAAVVPALTCPISDARMPNGTTGEVSLPEGSYVAMIGSGSSSASPNLRCIIEKKRYGATLHDCIVCGYGDMHTPAPLNPNVRSNPSLLVAYKRPCTPEEEAKFEEVRKRQTHGRGRSAPSQSKAGTTTSSTSTSESQSEREPEPDPFEDDGFDYILIDCGKTFREATARWFPRLGERGVLRVDSILLTHGHADAMLGLDDVRAIQDFGSSVSLSLKGRAVEVWMNAETSAVVAQSFPYLFPRPDAKKTDVARKVAMLVDRRMTPFRPFVPVARPAAGAGAQAEAQAEAEAQEEAKAKAVADSASSSSSSSASSSSVAASEPRVGCGCHEHAVASASAATAAAPSASVSSSASASSTSIPATSTHASAAQPAQTQQASSSSVTSSSPSPSSSSPPLSPSPLPPGLVFTPITLFHGGTYVCMGFVFGGAEVCVYLSDLHALTPETQALLAELTRARRIDLLVVDALFLKSPHNAHLSFPEAMELIRQLKPRRAVLTGQSDQIEFHRENATLQEFRARVRAEEGVDIEVSCGRDGMVIPLKL